MWSARRRSSRRARHAGHDQESAGAGMAHDLDRVLVDVAEQLGGAAPRRADPRRGSVRRQDHDRSAWAAASPRSCMHHDHRVAAVGAAARDAEDLLLVADVERRGRFVEQEDARLSCASTRASAARACSPPDSDVKTAPRQLRGRRCRPSPRPRRRRRGPRPSVPAHGARPMRTTCGTVNGNDRPICWSSTPRRMRQLAGDHDADRLRRRSRPTRRRASRSPASTPSSVDLPAPFGPTSARTSPACTARSTPRARERRRSDTVTPDASARTRAGLDGPGRRGWRRGRAASAHAQPPAWRAGAPQQPEEERPADQRGEHADRQVGVVDGGAGHEVGEDERRAPRRARSRGPACGARAR